MKMDRAGGRRGPRDQVEFTTFGLDLDPECFPDALVPVADPMTVAEASDPRGSLALCSAREDHSTFTAPIAPRPKRQGWYISSTNTAGCR